jgi:magnesium chelatase family protein
MRTAMGQLQLSARGYHRMLKRSRTIADPAGDDDIRSHPLAEALQCRPKVVALALRCIETAGHSAGRSELLGL